MSVQHWCYKVQRWLRGLVFFWRPWIHFGKSTIILPHLKFRKNSSYIGLLDSPTSVLSSFLCWYKIVRTQKRCNKSSRHPIYEEVYDKLVTYLESRKSPFDANRNTNSGIRFFQRTCSCRSNDKLIRIIRLFVKLVSVVDSTAIELLSTLKNEGHADCREGGGLIVSVVMVTLFSYVIFCTRTKIW